MKTLIVGGGMAGLTYGILAAQKDSVTICERNSRVGKKLSTTGNGRCNLGNMDVSPNQYNQSEIVRAVLDCVSVEKYVDFLHSCGIYVFSDATGRLYPLSESAANVVDCLRCEFSRRGGTFLCDCEVTAVLRQKKGYVVTFGNKHEFFDKVVLACGSSSGLSNGASLRNLVKESYLTPLVPSLVAVKTTQKTKVLAGLRAKAKVDLIEDGVVVASESGEVQFRDFGLSGICVFNLSAHIARSRVLNRKHKYSFSVDLVPQLTLKELTEILQQRQLWQQETVFYGILHNKIAQYVLGRASVATATELARTAKQLVFDFDDLMDFSVSQVTSGGVDEKFVDKRRLTLPDGTIVLGEMLNVDGVCGGYNLFFAAASAIYAYEQEAING